MKAYVQFHAFLRGFVSNFMLLQSQKDELDLKLKYMEHQL